MTNIISAPKRMSIVNGVNENGDEIYTLTHEAKRMTFNEEEAYFVVHELAMMFSPSKLAYLSLLFSMYIHNSDKEENFLDEIERLLTSNEMEGE